MSRLIAVGQNCNFLHLKSHIQIVHNESPHCPAMRIDVLLIIQITYAHDRFAEILFGRKEKRARQQYNHGAFRVQSKDEIVDTDRFEL